jgi:hypothetical protein
MGCGLKPNTNLTNWVNLIPVGLALSQGRASIKFTNFIECNNIDGLAQLKTMADPTAC